MDDLNKLSVLTYVAAAYADKTAEAWDYSRDNFSAALALITDYIYCGYTKPINSLYVEMATPNATPGTMVAEYWNGTAWTVLPLLVEDTKLFTRSGFIKWEKQDDWELLAVNTIEKFWVRFSMAVAASHSATFKGINLVFADDNDLKARRRDILSLLPNDENQVPETSFILAHVSAREEILQYFSKEGQGKYNSTNGRLSELNQWDLHNFDQVRKAAIAFALYFIFDGLSDTKDDLYDTKAERYRGEAYQNLKIFLLSYDKDDDGKESNAEANVNYFETRLTR